ncbi:hypothetical protein DFQ29_000982 [Apophysomyces sp. BC1021]|nr:hypothetical protein DFQ29_000982 [Apophysomyces sp. BC1021]
MCQQYYELRFRCLYLERRTVYSSRRRRLVVSKDKDSRPSSIVSPTKPKSTVLTTDTKSGVVQPISPLDIKIDSRSPDPAASEEAWELRPISDPRTVSTQPSTHRYNRSEGSPLSTLQPTDTIDITLTQQDSLPLPVQRHHLQKNEQVDAINTGTHRRVKSNV